MTQPLPTPGSLLAPVCLKCGYDLAGLDGGGDACPECGAPVDRFPTTSVFTCTRAEVATRRPLMNINTLPYLFGPAAAAPILMIFEFRKAHPRPWIPVITCGVLMFVIWVPVLLVRAFAGGGAPVKVTVDIPGRRLRFENVTLNRNWGWPAFTGDGLDVPFDDIVAVDSGTFDGGVSLNIHTRRGRITLTSALTNFFALAAVLESFAPLPSKKTQVWLTIIMLVAACVGTGVLFQVGIWLRWW